MVGQRGGGLELILQGTVRRKTLLCLSGRMEYEVQCQTYDQQGGRHGKDTHASWGPVLGADGPSGGRNPHFMTVH